MMTEEMMNKHSKIWRVFQGNLDDFFKWSQNKSSIYELDLSLNI